MKFYEFVDKEPPIGRIAVIEGTERVLAERALEIALDRLLPPDVRELNLQRFAPEDVGDASGIAEAVSAMPFLADRRVTVVTDAQALKAALRQRILQIAEGVPEGNTLVLCDLLSPGSKKVRPLGSQLGRGTLRVDTTAGEATRERFVAETLERLGVSADPKAFRALAGATDLAAVGNALGKLALSNARITLEDLQHESLSIEDPKTYEYAGAVVEGNLTKALETAQECFDADPRSAVKLLTALAAECGYLQEMTRRNGTLPARVAWRERFLRPLARRVGVARARQAQQRALDGVAAVVTGRVAEREQHVLVDRIAVELSEMSKR
jgi:DNA polymerase III delta subunit